MGEVNQSDTCGRTKKVAANKATAIVASLSLIITTSAPVYSQTADISRDDYTACQTQDEATFRNAINTITLQALRKGTQTIDYGALVRDQWRKHKLDEVVDKRVDLAAAEVRSETSWGQLLKSLAYRDKAKELATAVAERVYRSDAMKAALETMAIGVGREIGRTIELTTSDAALPAQRCLRAFLGPRYGRTIARAVITDTGVAFKLDPKENSAAVTGGSVARTASGGIAGAVILLVRRQLARMAQRLGQRIVGSILGRLVAVVAGGVGLILIAKDVWDLRYGVLPIITTEMKAETTKAKVRDELALAIKNQISLQMEALAEATSERIVDIWRDFRRAHAKVVELAASNPEFKRFLDLAEPNQLPRLDEIVSLIIKRSGDQGLTERLASGTLQRAVNTLSDEGMQIAREQGSVDDALAWSNLATRDLANVIRYELHRRTVPDQFSQSSLTRLLSLSDPLVVTRLAAVKRSSRDVLFDLGDDKLAGLARGLEAGELETLTGYITGLAANARQTVLNTVAETPARMRVLASERVRAAVISSRDQEAAVGMMLRPDKALDIGSIGSDVQLVIERRVNPILLWDKHPAVVIAAAILMVLLLLILRRILIAPRRRPPAGGETAA